MKSRLIALDIDGTILDVTQGFYIPAFVRETINEARAGGARVCLCSSRPTYFMEDALKDLDEIDALIGCSGAAIDIAGKRFLRDSLPLSIVPPCIEIAKKWDLYMSCAGEEKILALGREGLNFAMEADPLFAFLPEEELLRAISREIISCAFIFTEPGMELDIVKEAPALAEANVTQSGLNNFTITQKGVDKGTGVLKLAEHWGIPAEAILAVGNDENDIPMFKAAGVGVAVANANPEVFDFADWIAPDVKNGGAAEAIRRFAL